MQQQNRHRISLAALAVLLFVAFSFDPSPSDPATPGPYDMPPRNAAAVTQDLQDFMVVGSAAGDGRFHAFQPADLTVLKQTAAPEPRRLSLLDPGVDLEAERRFLHRIPYGTALAVAAERQRIDPLLLAAVVSVESGFSAKAVSSEGAMGLMQVVPEVAQDFGITGDLLDPYVNADVGSRYLRSLLKDYDGDLERVLAAYNAGPGVVDRYKGVPPYRETRQFVREVLAQYDRYSRKVHPRATS